METIWQDIRYAARLLFSKPGFLVVAVLTLGLGIGANTAIFSVVNAVLLRPLPYRDSDRLVRIIQNRSAQATAAGLPPRLAAISTDDLQEFRTRTQTLSHVAAYGASALTMTGREEPIRMTGTRVSPSLFSMLGISPLIGRTFEPGEDQPGADSVIVLSYGAWQKYFAADSDILNRTLMLEGKGYSVVGVMPQAFDFPDRVSEFWVPFVLTPSVRVPGERTIQIVQTIARVKDGVSLAAATSEANTIFMHLREEEAKLDAQEMAESGGPDAPRDRPADGPPRGSRGAPGGMRGGMPGMPAATIELGNLKEELVAPVRPALLVLAASVGFVLLISCANVANLLLARAAARHQEIAIRAALGAGRGRLIRQVLTESIMLSLMGGAFGTLLAVGGVDLLSLPGSGNIPRLDEIRIDFPVFAFTMGVSLLTGILFGIMPALRLSRTDQMQAIKEGAASTSSGVDLFGKNRTRSLLAIAEIALAMVLLVGAGLLINSFLKLSNVYPGYQAKNILTFQVATPSARYAEAQRMTFYDQLLTRLKDLPGVQSAALSNTLPMQPGVIRIGMGIVGRPRPNRSEDMTVADVRVISSDYLATMGIRLTEGRTLNPRAGEGQPNEVLVNRAFVRQYLANEQALGKQLNLDGPEPWEIVGIVDDVRHTGLDAEPTPELYVHYRQTAAVLPRGLGGAFFTVRTTGEPASLVAPVRGIVRQSDPQIMMDNVSSMEQRVANSVARPRFYAVLLGLFAVIAVVIAAVGIYGVMAYSVSQRTREIGIRMALGAKGGEVLGMVLRQGMALAAIGIVLGIAGAAVVTRYLQSMLFGLTRFDPMTFVVVSAGLALIAIVACYVPARRATKVDPIIALRYQ